MQWVGRDVGGDGIFVKAAIAVLSLTYANGGDCDGMLRWGIGLVSAEER